jgi:PAS domain-containing protein
MDVHGFVLQENIRRLRDRIAEATDDATRRELKAMLATVERELALIAVAQAGAGAPPWPIGAAEDLQAERASLVDDFRREYGGSSLVAYLLDPAPGLLMVEVNRAFELATGRLREAVVGKPLFALFPDNPAEGNADGIVNIYASLRLVAETGRPHAMPDLRYDVASEDGTFVERHWRAVNTAIGAENGHLVLLQHVVQEVTDEVMGVAQAS